MSGEVTIFFILLGYHASLSKCFGTRWRWRTWMRWQECCRGSPADASLGAHVRAETSCRQQHQARFDNFQKY